jgi:acyl-CoA synthetase (AMP-forming)/AMP-acid ligase II/phosphohistidine swiveling domain-containing protein
VTAAPGHAVRWVISGTGQEGENMRSLTGWLEQPSTDCGINVYDGSRWERVTYAGLAAEVFAAAAQLRAEGVGPGDRVALALASGLSFARYFFAAMVLGATPTPIAPPGYQGRGDYPGFALSRLSVLQPSCVVAETATIGQLGPHMIAAAGPRFIDQADPLPAVAAGGGGLPGPLALDDLALIQFTSGSSSAPRAVTLTGSALLAQISILAEVADLGARESFSSWLPLHHDMGLIGLFLTPVVLGAELWLLRPEHFVRRPADWLATFGHHGVRQSATPCFGLAQLVRRVTPESLDGMDFSDWQSLIVGADRISYETLEAARQLLAPHGLSARVITPAYGMAEATLAVVAARRAAAPSAVRLESADFRSGAPVRVIGEHSLDRPEPAGTARAAGHLVVSCGHEPTGIGVTVIDEAGRPLPDGHVGELRVRSPALSLGYLADPAENERFTADGYLTGDLGFRRHDQVYLLGRVGDSVKVNGRFITAEDVELALMDVLAVPQDRIAVVLRDTGDAAVTLVAVQQHIENLEPDRIADVIAAFGLDPLGFAVLEVPRRSVPRTTSSKPRRGQLWRELGTGDLDADALFVGRKFPFRFAADAAAHAVAPGRVDLGGKGYHLTVIQAEHLPVPPFIVLGAAELAAGTVGTRQLRRRLRGLVHAAASVFGVAEPTVGLAVRSSPPRSMPGMMDTLLGLGLRPDDADALADRLGSRDAAWETLARQAEQLCRLAAGASDADLRAAGPQRPAQARWATLTTLFTELTGRPYPAGRAEQVSAAVAAVRDSWSAPRARDYRHANQIPDHPGPAVVVQAMAFGTASGVSGSGVVFSHNPLTGEPGLFGEFLPAATGEGLVSGTRTPEPVALLRESSAELFGDLQARVDQLFRALHEMVDVEFVVERGRLWLVQVRPAAAAEHVLNRVRVQAWQEDLIPAVDALLRLDVDALFEPMPAQAQPRPGDRLLAIGLPACPGAISGPVAVSTDDVLAQPPGAAILLRPATEPSDFAGMLNAAALLTLEGGTTSHAAVIARELGLPALVALRSVDPDWDLLAGLAHGTGEPAAALPEITICGTTGKVWAGRVPVTAAAPLPRPAHLFAAAAPGVPEVALGLPLGLPPSPSGGQPIWISDEVSGAPLAVRADGAAPGPTLRAVACAEPGALPGEVADQLVATADPATAEEWVLKGGRVVFVHPPVPDQSWRAVLPGCDLAAVVLADPGQLEHARWLLAQRAARRLSLDDDWELARNL